MSEFSDCEGHTDSFAHYIPRKLTKGKRMEGSVNIGKKALEPVTRPEGDKKGNARGGRRPILGDGVVDKTNMRPLQPLDDSDDDGTHNLSTKITDKDTNHAQSGSNKKIEGTGCTHFKTVWGLRLDLLLLAIVVVIIAVILKLPLGAQQVVIGNPASQQQLRDLEKQFYEVTNKMEVLESKVKSINEEMKTTNDTVSKVREIAKTANEMVDKANANLKIMEQHLFNKDALTAAILILFLLIIGLMLYVLKLKASLEPPLAGGSSSRPLKGSRKMEVVLQKMPSRQTLDNADCNGSRDMEVILQKMPSRPTLDNAVCIVSFDANSLDEYKRMIKGTVGQLGGVCFRTHVIRKHADTAELPHCRLYMMCVEFTERHVIIEEQGLGLGDLKLTLYRGIRKLGGALVILYIHDPGSRNLSDDQLYSDGFYCVKKQQELKELCELDRFISAHKKLNTAQKKALETAISNVLNIQAARY